MSIYMLANFSFNKPNDSFIEGFSVHLRVKNGLYMGKSPSG